MDHDALINDDMLRYCPPQATEGATMRFIIHSFVIKGARSRVYDAVATREGLAGWWTADVRGESKIGGTLSFRFADVFKPEMRVVDLQPGRLVKWTCVGGEERWRDNGFSFELSDEGQATRLMFRQEYARELDDTTYGEFNYNWGYYLTSLKSLCETGTGRPFGATAPDAGAKAVAMRLAAEVFSGGNMKTFDDIIADNYVNHNMPVPSLPGTKDGFRQIVAATRDAFSDLHVHVRDMVTEGPFVVFRDNVEATSKAPFFGVPPNGAKLAWTEIHFLRVDDGKIVEHWTNFDQLGILRQLGAIP
jgi:steroid delta-isomerase-like uncharacterized protein